MSFDSLGLSDHLLRAVQTQGYDGDLDGFLYREASEGFGGDFLYSRVSPWRLETSRKARVAGLGDYGVNPM